MQTFLPYPVFTASARVLDDKRLGKQRIECLQILQTLTKEKTETIQVEQSDGTLRTIVRATPWYNHPAVRMWRGYENSLLKYSLVICNTWIDRGFNDTVREKLLSLTMPLPLTSPSWLGNPAFHASHRSNLLRKDPVHYGQFGWTEKDDLPYVWPV